MEVLKITVFCLLAAIGYGILHDLVTAHLCVEYFTLAHPPVFRTQSPVLLALGWGVLATWWMGLPLGLLLALVARIGPPPRLGLAELRPWILRLLAAMALCTACMGALGGGLFMFGWVPVPGGWAGDLPPDRWLRFTMGAWAHGASYAAGFFGGLLLICLVMRRRLRMSESVQARTAREQAAKDVREFLWDWLPWGAVLVPAALYFIAVYPAWELEIAVGAMLSTLVYSLVLVVRRRLAGARGPASQQDRS